MEPDRRFVTAVFSLGAGEAAAMGVGREIPQRRDRVEEPPAGQVRPCPPKDFDDDLCMADAGEVEGREAVAQGRIPLRLLAPKSLTLRPAPKPVSQSPEPFDPHSSHHPAPV